MVSVSKIKVITTSLVSVEDLQLVVLEYECKGAGHLYLSVFNGNTPLVDSVKVTFNGGVGAADVMLPVQNTNFDATWVLKTRDADVVISEVAPWRMPRNWTIYAMVSSHTDIGLHNSQYIQRYTSSAFIDKATALYDKTENNNDNDRYRYTMEGTWFWNNYGMDRGKEAADRIVKDYVHKGNLGACSGIAGNHIQTFGLEEMCRSTYEKRRLEDQWGIESETMAMIDNNGLPWSMISPYVDAGYKNIIFAPNHWNPKLSKIWKKRLVGGEWWNPDTARGGARIDVRYTSDLPMVFNWEDDNGKKITVWASTQYEWGGEAFGIYPRLKHAPYDYPEGLLYYTEDKMRKQLELLESKYPYDIWLFACYGDDQEPDTFVLDQIRRWNKKWKWPCLRTLGDPNVPFNILREKFGDQIPTLKGDITGGWYQHPLTVPELMSQKFEVDRLLPDAEKWSTIAGMLDSKYEYPAIDFRRAWDYLLYNDEHSYGTSGYRGRRVYETWMQHRDWINKAENTAIYERNRALESISSKINAGEDSVVIFNSGSNDRNEYFVLPEENKYVNVCVPKMGYACVPKSEFSDLVVQSFENVNPPIIENEFYIVKFSDNGSICSIYDKEIQKELLDTENEFKANELVYTKDNHVSFITPHSASFKICKCRLYTQVVAEICLEQLGSRIIQTVTLPDNEKRIDIDNNLYHVKDMINTDRYNRYIYYAFPFMVENSRRLCHLNGTVAEYAKDITGHGTDVYMEVNEWCCSENGDFGVALMMKDAHLIEFDHIHPEKTDLGEAGNGSQMFSYVANDWLQMHVAGGRHLNYCFRYSVTSYVGNYKNAGIPLIAERYVNPMTGISILAQSGEFKDRARSLLDLSTDMRLLCLKRADDGCGVIARFYGEYDENQKLFDAAMNHELSTVDERPTNEGVNKGFITFRLGRDNIRICAKKEEELDFESDKPLPIGSVYTGLITKPMAAAGENMGHLYLLWGASREADFSHYKLYRSEFKDFVPDESNMIAEVYPEEYVVGRYVDTGLKDDTCYYYKVCAVNKAGVCGDMSEEFSAYTREPMTD